MLISVPGKLGILLNKILVWYIYFLQMYCLIHLIVRDFIPFERIYLTHLADHFGNFYAVELRQCVGLVELSLEHNKLVRPLLDFRSFNRR